MKNKCLECGKATDSKFCSKSCSATYNNKGIVRNGKPAAKCKNCGKKTARSNYTYCSNNCQQDYQLEQRIASGKFSEKTAKKYLLKHNKNRCSVCNLTKWNGQPIPIELDHINGNSKDNSLSNLRLICPNCHAQTKTYKGKNMGNGRHQRMKRYYEGKSY